MSGVNFTTYDAYLKTKYIPKALDTHIYSDKFVDLIKRLPITEPVVGNKTRVPFDLRRIFNTSATFSEAQALAKLNAVSDMDQAWEVPVASCYTVQKISTKALRAGANDEGAIFRTIVNAGNKALAALRLKILTDIFSDTPGSVGVVNAAVSSGATFVLKEAAQVASFDKGDQLEFRNAAGAKKGTGYAIVDEVILNTTLPSIKCTANLPALAKDDIVYKRGDYGKTHIFRITYCLS